MRNLHLLLEVTITRIAIESLQTGKLRPTIPDLEDALRQSMGLFSRLVRFWLEL